MEKILDLTMLSDIFPTGFHGAYTAGVGAGLDGLRRRRRPGRARGRLLGAAARRRRRDRRRPGSASGSSRRARSAARRWTSPRASPKDQIEQILGVPEVDAAVDAVGFEARGHGGDAEQEAPATVLNSHHGRHPGGRQARHPGPLRDRRSRGRRRAAKEGSLSIRIGLGWAKSHSFTTGQCPVMRYHRGLMQMILNDRARSPRPSTRR